jgi:CheY-like chemotaxis protein
MPEMSGWEVARELKKLNPRVWVVLTTGWPVEMSPEEMRARGIDRVVPKPFDMPQLFKLIGEALASQ